MIPLTRNPARKGNARPNGRARRFLLIAVVFAVSACGTPSTNSSPRPTNSVLQAKLRLFGQAFCQSWDQKARAYDHSVETPETKAIAATFSNYIAAGDRMDGAKLTALVTPDTHDLFAQLARRALRADRAELESLPFALRLWTLSLRQDFPADALRTMTGLELVEAAGELGRFAAETRVSDHLRHYFINDRFAVAYLDLSCGEIDDFGYNFEKVDGEWRSIWFERLGSTASISIAWRAICTLAKTLS